jgi:hypothetical protein|tara:strand:+ start:778 stop:1182 length:405 start_codon:yes stop_codon:yes gene_type:complete
MNKCNWCENTTKNKEHYTAMSPLSEKYEILIQGFDEKYGQFWYDSDKIDKKLLKEVSLYDQATNTVGKGIICDDCHEKDEMIYQKYRLITKKDGDPYGILKIVIDDDDNEYGLDEMNTWYQETKKRVSKVGKDK